MSLNEKLLDGQTAGQGISGEHDKDEVVTAMLDDKYTFYVPDDPSNYPVEDQF